MNGRNGPTPWSEEFEDCLEWFLSSTVIGAKRPGNLEGASIMAASEMKAKLVALAPDRFVVHEGKVMASPLG